MTTLQTFAAYLHDRATETGYRVNRRRGKHALAKAAGMSYDDLAATLAATHCPDPMEIERLANALGEELTPFLLNSGMVKPRSASDTR